jgi:hypothetical protein
MDLGRVLAEARWLAGRKIRDAFDLIARPVLCAVGHACGCAILWNRTRPERPQLDTMSDDKTTDRCRLCGAPDKLLLSHILPAFVFRWFRESSGTGHIRSTAEPNLRVQDGIKRHWLCAGCEELFSRSETRFATDLFHPYLTRSGERFAYREWLLHFCASVSWRVLRLAMEDGALAGWSAVEQERVAQAELAWREYLLRKRPHPGAHRQILLPMDEIASSTRQGLAPNFNRYIMRGINMDICRGTESIFTYSKLGRFIIIGWVHEPNPGQWKGAQVNANRGAIEPRQYVLPIGMLDYLDGQARKSAAALDSVSDRQREKIAQSFSENKERFAGSDMFAAMQADVNMFGSDAFSKPKDA